MFRLVSRPLPKLKLGPTRIAPQFIRWSNTKVKDAIVDDHEELAEYYEKYLAATTPTDKAKWANQYKWELARHTVAEELVLYPAFEKYLGKEGKKVADKERVEHQQQKELQYRLEQMKITDPEYKSIFQKLHIDLSVHLLEEEATIDKLAEVIDKAEDESLAKTISQTKGFVPTRAHPGTHQQPPFETVEALLLAPLDKLKDLFATWPTKEEKKA